MEITRKVAASLLGENVRSSAPIARGVALSYGHLFASIIATMILTPIILRYIGQSAYGLWATFGSALGYFGILDFGMNFATVKYTAEYHARSDAKALSGLVSSMVVVIGSISAVIIIVCFGLMPLIPRLFHLPASLVSTGQIAFCVMGSNVALGLVAGIFMNVIYGMQRVDIIKAFGIIQITSSACLTVLFLRWGFGLTGVVLATSVALFTSMILSLVFIHKKKYGISISPHYVELKALREIAPYSLRSFILALTAQVLYNTNYIVIGVFLTVAAVTPYSIAYKLCYLAAIVMYKVSDAMFPTFTRLFTLQDMEGLRSLYVRTARIAVTIVVPFALMLALAGRELIDLWVGDKNFAGQSVLMVLVFMNFIHATAGPAGQLLQAVGKNKEFTYSATIDAILNLALSILLCRHIGLLGVPLGTLVAHLCTDTWVVIWLACKYIGLSLRTYFLKGILPPLLSGAPAGLITWRLFAELPRGHLVVVGLKGFSIVAIYLVTVMALELFPRLRFPRVSMAGGASDIV